MESEARNIVTNEIQVYFKENQRKRVQNGGNSWIEYMRIVGPESV